MIEAGQPAPDFTLRDQDGNEVSLEDLRGKRTVLVFYPSDFSPVCTDQLNVYQEVVPELEEQGVQLYGVSVDGVFCHKAFQEKLGVSIPLLADFHPKGEVTQKYGLFAEKPRGREARARDDRARPDRGVGAQVALAARDPRGEPDLRRRCL